MRAIRPAWRSLRLIARPHLLNRAQHNHGPHKEYFQNPGQTPLPDTTPYAQPIVQQQVVKAGPSLFARAFRSVFWAVLFTSIGVIAGTSIITWEYMQPPFEPGSPEEEELYEEIIETLQTHPLVEDLRKENWIEENFYITRSHGEMQNGLNLVHERLTGTQGMTVKAFRHPTQEYSLLVFFLGFGIEGWPDTIHGGIITTLLLEAVGRHTRLYHKDYTQVQDKFVNVDFKVPVRPGEIYAVLVPPSMMISEPDRPEEAKIRTMSLLMPMELAPRVKTEFDAQTNSENHTIEIPSHGGTNITHAIASVDFRKLESTNDGTGVVGFVNETEQP